MSGHHLNYWNFVSILYFLTIKLLKWIHSCELRKYSQWAFLYLLIVTNIFVAKLQISGFQAERDYGLVRGDNDGGNGYRIRDARRATYELRDRHIARQAADLRTNRITVREFLELASGQINPILPLIVEEEEEGEEIGKKEGPAMVDYIYFSIGSSLQN